MSATKAPLLRAIVLSDQRVVIVAWSDRLEYSEAACGPLSENDARWFSSPHGCTIFEIWQGFETLIARAVGLSRPGAAQALGQWALENRRALVIGPALPDTEAVAGLSIVTEHAHVPPRFLFRIDPDGGWTVLPWGFDGLQLDGLVTDWDGCIGELRETESDQLTGVIATPGHYDADGVARILSEWAVLDDWQIQHVVHGPLSAPQFAQATPTGSRCELCEQELGTGIASHMGFSQNRWVRTRCRRCGSGRRRWWITTDD